MTFCSYCGQKLTHRWEITIDHIIPKSKGGKNRNRFNLADCCHSCNGDKADKLPHQFLVSILQKYENICLLRPAPTSIMFSKKIKYEIMIENIKYIIDHVDNHGKELFSKNSSYKSYLTEAEYLKPGIERIESRLPNYSLVIITNKQTA